MKIRPIRVIRVLFYKSLLRFSAKNYSLLDGFYGKSEGIFTIINGSIPEVKESLKNIVIKKEAQRYTFSTDDNLNFIVFRDVQNSDGYIININKVERQGNTFTVYVTYIDPEKGIFVTGALTYPGAIIPIGRLAAGDYEAALKVPKVLNTIEEEIEIETEKESGVFNFEIKNRDGSIMDTGNSTKICYTLNLQYTDFSVK